MSDAQSLNEVVGSGDPEAIIAYVKANAPEGEELDEAINTALNDDDEDVFAALLSGGVDPMHRDGGGKTLLHWAARFGRIDAVRRLLELGAEIDARDSQTYTPLIQAIESQDVDLARYMIERGADAVSIVDGWGPVMQAAHQGSLEIFEAIVAAGADPLVRTEEQGEPFDHALKQGNDDIADFIRAARRKRFDIPESTALRGVVPETGPELLLFAKRLFAENMTSELAVDSALHAAALGLPSADLGAAFYIAGRATAEKRNSPKFPLALRHFDRALAADARHVDSLIWRGVVRSACRQREDALADLDRAVELDAGNARAYFERARIHHTAGRIEAAEADLETARRLDPNDGENWLWLAMIEHGRGNGEQVEALLGGAIERGSRKAANLWVEEKVGELTGPICFLVGMHRTTQNDPNRTYKAFTRAEALGTGSPETEVESRLQRIRLDIGFETYDDARQAIAELEELIPGDVRVLLARAEVAHAEGDGDTALAAYRETRTAAREGSNEETRAVHGLARALILRKAFGEAADLLSPLLARAPRDGAGRYWMAMARQGAGDHAGAIREFRLGELYGDGDCGPARSRYYGNETGYDFFCSGLAHHRSGNLGSATRDYRIAVDRLRRETRAADDCAHRHLVGAQNNLGHAIAAGDTRNAAAAEEYRRALELDPCSIDAMINLANHDAICERFDAAEQLLTRAVGIDDANGGVYYARGMARKWSKRHADAAADFAHATEWYSGGYQADAFFELALCQEALGRVDDAIGSYRKADEGGHRGAADELYRLEGNRDDDEDDAEDDADADDGEE